MKALITVLGILFATQAFAAKKVVIEQEFKLGNQYFAMARVDGNYEDLNYFLMKLNPNNHKPIWKSKILFVKDDSFYNKYSAFELADGLLTFKNDRCLDDTNRCVCVRFFLNPSNGKVLSKQSCSEE